MLISQKYLNISQNLNKKFKQYETCPVCNCHVAMVPMHLPEVLDHTWRRLWEIWAVRQWPDAPAVCRVDHSQCPDERRKDPSSRMDRSQCQTTRCFLSLDPYLELSENGDLPEGQSNSHCLCIQANNLTFICLIFFKNLNILIFAF